MLAPPVIAQDSTSPQDNSPRNDSQQTDTNQQRSPAASALTTIFSPARAPREKTMGLLQRSFLDLAEQGDQELELAIVVDGTDSMAPELAGVRQSIQQMLEDLRKFRDNDVRVALVVYRDAESPSGEVEILLDRFTADPQAIERAVQRLRPESGAPYFHELADEGIHQALTNLPWTDDPQVTKWLLLFGDAPPYSPSFNNDEYPEARRRYSDAILVGIAKRRNIRINSILCTSGDNVSEPYSSVVDQTRTFMTALTSGTDGLMLDLSYPQIRTAMVEAAEQPQVGLAKIEPIREIDLAAARRNVSQANNQVRQVNLAVIPHMPLNQMTFAANHPAVQVSTALRTQLSSVPGVRVASPRDIKEQLRRLKAEGLQGDQAIRGLASRLGVDFVVWGSLADNQSLYRSAAYRRDSGQPIIPISFQKNSGDTAYAVIQASARNLPDDQALVHLMNSMQSVRQAVTAPLASSPATTDDLLTAIEALEQALAYEAGSDESVELLEQADRASRNARTAEPRNAMAHWLQANVAYNQAARLYQQGELDAADRRMMEMRASLSEAVAQRESLADPSLITEIEADYYLLVARNVDEAVKRYQKMTEPDQPLKTQLRGHWTLAGIYAGDYGLDKDPIVDSEKAREHVVEVLANWPDSPETSLLKEWLRWDETSDQTQFNYLPQINAGLTGA